MLRIHHGLLLLALTLPLGGCNFLSDFAVPGGPTGTGDTAGVGSVLDPGFGAGIPSVDSGNVRVELTNLTERDADVRITMRVLGEQVHFSTQTVAPDDSIVVVGPDRADTVLVETTLLGDSPQSLPAQTFTLGQEFQPGDTIVIEITDPAVPLICRDSDDLVVTFDNLPEMCIATGTPVPFDVLAVAVTAEARLRVFADADSDHQNGNEIEILADASVGDGFGLTWNTSDTVAGTYQIYAELADGDCFLRAGPALGRIHVDAQSAGFLSVAIEGLETGFCVAAGTPIEFNVTAQSATADARVRVFADPDSDPDNGNELTIADNLEVSGTVAVVWDTTQVPPGTYALYAETNDGECFARFGPAAGRIHVDAPNAGFLSVAIEGLETGFCVAAGMPIEFNVTAQSATAAARVRVFADPDGDPDNGNELTIADNLEVSGTIAVVWDTTQVPSDIYALFAEMNDGECFTRFGPAPGSIGVQHSTTPLFSVDIVGLEQDLRLNAGAAVSFDVLTSGAVVAGLLRVFADVDGDPDNGNEIDILRDVPAEAVVPVSWQTDPNLSPGDLLIYAEVTEGACFERFGPAPGRVRINFEPMLVLTGPVDELLVMQGLDFIIAWAGTDDDDSALIDLYLDVDETFPNGNELLLAENIPEDDPNFRELSVPTATIAAGDYRVVGVIRDELTTVVTPGPIVCITQRLAGRFLPSNFGPGQITTIVGNVVPGLPENVALGSAIDISGDLNNDGFADLLVSDPRALFLDPKFGQEELGVVYYHEQTDGLWPFELSVDNITLRVIGEEVSTLPGTSVALTNRIDDDLMGDILIGAPQYDSGQGGEDGRIYVLDGENVRTQGTLFLFEPGTPNGTALTGRDDGRAGSRVAALSDVNGDESDDVAVAEPLFNNGAGRVGIIAGRSPLLPSGNVGEIGAPTGIRGVLLTGEVDGDQAGFSVADAGRFDCSAGPCAFSASVLIGAPGANNLAGSVYLILGGNTIFQQGAIALADVGGSWPGFVFHGESPGDWAGAAVASGDFDGDGRPDLLIGAPLYAGGRGRVYLIYNFTDQSVPSNIALAEVGANIPGAMLDGVFPGDFFGFSLANAGDTDRDGIDDLIIGAPGAGGLTGAAYVLYGGQGLAGVASITDLPSCDLQGWQISGELQGELLGTAVSGGGDLNGDGAADVAIGAPGTIGGGGAAYLILGIQGAAP